MSSDQVTAAERRVSKFKRLILAQEVQMGLCGCSLMRLGWYHLHLRKDCSVHSSRSEQYRGHPPSIVI